MKRAALTTIAAAATASMTAVVAACGGTGNGEAVSTVAAQPPKVELMPPTAERLIGTWSLIGGKMLVQFKENGAFAIDTDDLSSPFARGTYALTGRTIRFSSRSVCYDPFTWRADLLPATDRGEDELHIRVVHGACGASDGEEWQLARIS